MNYLLFKTFGKYDTQLKFNKALQSNTITFGYWKLFRKNYAPNRVEVPFEREYEFTPLFSDQIDSEESALKSKRAWRDFQYCNTLQLTRRV